MDCSVKFFFQLRVNDTKEVESMRRQLVFWSWSTIVLLPAVILLLLAVLAADSLPIIALLLVFDGAILIGKRRASVTQFLTQEKKKVA